MRSRLTSVCILSYLMLVAFNSLPADDPPNKDAAKTKANKQSPEKPEKESARPAGLVPLYKFYDKRLFENVYSHRENEIKSLRSIPTMEEQMILGDVSTVKLPDTVRLWRSVRNGDRKHYHYLRAPGQATKMIIESDLFTVYVWKKPGDGRIPIYCHTWIDGTDVCFDPDLNKLRLYREESKKALGVYRLGLHRADFSIPVFYIYPHKDKTDDEKSKPATDSAKAKST